MAELGEKMEFRRIQDLDYDQQKLALENFLKQAFSAEKATILPYTEEMKNDLELNTIVKIETIDRGDFYIALIKDLNEDKNTEDKK